MDFITLCKAVARESVTLASLGSFTTVVGATDRRAKIVGWTRDAWIDLQNARTDWRWMRRQFSHALTIGQTSYTATDLGITRLKRFIADYPGHRTFTLYNPAIGKSDEGAIAFIPYELWLQKYDRGVHDSNRVTEWSVSPEGKLLIGPKPDKAYMLRGEHLLSAQQLAADADVPECPEDFHRVIVYEALILMKAADRQFASLSVDANEYTRLRQGLVIDQTPGFVLAEGPLA